MKLNTWKIYARELILVHTSRGHRWRRVNRPIVVLLAAISFSFVFSYVCVKEFLGIQQQWHRFNEWLKGM